jgi:hypothetical protein
METTITNKQRVTNSRGKVLSGVPRRPLMNHAIPQPLRKQATILAMDFTSFQHHLRLCPKKWTFFGRAKERPNAYMLFGQSLRRGTTNMPLVILNERVEAGDYQLGIGLHAGERHGNMINRTGPAIWGSSVPARAGFS